MYISQKLLFTLILIVNFSLCIASEKKHRKDFFNLFYKELYKYNQKTEAKATRYIKKLLKKNSELKIFFKGKKKNILTMYGENIQKQYKALKKKLKQEGRPSLESVQLWNIIQQQKYTKNDFEKIKQLLQNGADPNHLFQYHEEKDLYKGVIEKGFTKLRNLLCKVPPKFCHVAKLLGFNDRELFKKPDYPTFFMTPFNFLFFDSTCYESIGMGSNSYKAKCIELSSKLSNNKKIIDMFLRNGNKSAKISIPIIVPQQKEYEPYFVSPLFQSLTTLQFKLLLPYKYNFKYPFYIKPGQYFLEFLEQDLMYKLCFFISSYTCYLYNKNTQNKRKEGIWGENKAKICLDNLAVLLQKGYSPHRIIKRKRTTYGCETISAYSKILKTFATRFSSGVTDKPCCRYNYILRGQKKDYSDIRLSKQEQFYIKLINLEHKTPNCRDLEYLYNGKSKDFVNRFVHCTGYNSLQDFRKSKEGQELYEKVYGYKSESLKGSCIEYIRENKARFSEKWLKVLSRDLRKLF